MVLGHSWGASVAASLALKHPETVSGLADVVLLSGPAVPIVGDILSYTLAPLARISHGSEAHRGL
jgi:pimeloyl-ACP methyl ester carboxylesterase